MVSENGADGRIPSPAVVDAWRDRIKRETFANYHYEMGAALSRTGDRAAAADHLISALDLQPDRFDALALLDTAGYPPEREGAVDVVRRRTLARERHAIELGLCRIAVVEHTAGRTDAALSRWRDVYRRAPDFQEARVYLAMGRLLSGELEAEAELRAGLPACRWTEDAAVVADVLLDAAVSARSDLPVAVRRGAARVALIVRPEARDGWLALVGLSNMLGDVDEAIRAHRMSVAVDPAYPSSSPGAPLFGLGRAVEAEKVVGRALIIAPDDPAAKAMMRDISLALGRFDQSIAAMRAGGDAERVDLAVTLQAAWRFDEAWDLFRKVEEGKLSPTNMTYLGLLALARDDVSEASRLMARAAETTPASAWIASCRCLARLRAGEGEGVLNDLRDLVETGAGGAWGWTDYGLALSAFGRREASLEAHARALKANPAWIWYQARFRPWAWEDLERAYDDLGFTTTPAWTRDGRS